MQAHFYVALNHVGASRLSFDDGLDRGMGDYALARIRARIVAGSFTIALDVDNLPDRAPTASPMATALSSSEHQYTPLGPRTFCSPFRAASDEKDRALAAAAAGGGVLPIITFAQEQRRPPAPRLDPRRVAAARAGDRSPSKSLLRSGWHDRQCVVPRFLREAEDPPGLSLRGPPAPLGRRRDRDISPWLQPSRRDRARFRQDRVKASR